MFLNPKFAWTGGFRYWHAKLRDTISLLAATRGVSYGEAMAFLGRRLAVLELIPYHSSNFHQPQRVISNLSSAQLARPESTCMNPSYLGADADRLWQS